jgi:hypothetical protein
MGTSIQVGDFIRLTENPRSLAAVSLHTMAGEYGVILNPDYVRGDALRPPSVLIWTSGSIVYVYRHHVYPAKSRFPCLGDLCPSVKRGTHRFSSSFNQGVMSLSYCMRCGAHYVNLDRYDSRRLGEWY